MRIGMCMPTEFKVIVFGVKKQKAAKKLSYEAVMQECCKIWGVYIYQLKGRSRTQKICDARFAAIKMIRFLNPTLSLEKIGKIFDGRDHTSMTYAIRIADSLIVTDTFYKAKYNLFIKAIKHLQYND